MICSWARRPDSAFFICVSADFSYRRHFVAEACALVKCVTHLCFFICTNGAVILTYNSYCVLIFEFCDSIGFWKNEENLNGCGSYAGWVEELWMGPHVPILRRSLDFSTCFFHGNVSIISKSLAAPIKTLICKEPLNLIIGFSHPVREGKDCFCFGQSFACFRLCVIDQTCLRWLLINITGCSHIKVPSNKFLATCV